MAKYSMEIRTMMNEPLINGVFTFDYSFYSDNVEDKKEFEKLFIDYFYFREIGFETPDRFKKKLEAKLNLIMPYYRQLAITEWNKVKTVELMMNSKNLTETTTHTLEETNKAQLSSSGKTNTNSNSNLSDSTSTNQSTSINMSDTTSQTTTNNNNHKESMIRDGIASVSLDNGLLTGTSQDSGTTSTDGTNTQTGTNTSESSQKQNNSQEISQSGSTYSDSEQQGNRGLTESTTFTSFGDVGIQTPAYAITEWRKVIINLNQMIINECEDLFLKIY